MAPVEDILRIAIGLGGAIDRFRRLAQKLVELGFAARHGRRYVAADARRDRDAGPRPVHRAGDMGLMAQPFVQKAVELADGNAGFGYFDLDVVVPVVGDSWMRRARRWIWPGTTTDWPAAGWPRLRRSGRARPGRAAPKMPRSPARRHARRPTPPAATKQATATPTHRVATRSNTPSHFSQMSRWICLSCSCR